MANAKSPTNGGTFTFIVDPERFELSSKQGISELSTKFRTHLVVGSSQAYAHTKLKLRC